MWQSCSCAGAGGAHELLISCPSPYMCPNSSSFINQVRPSLTSTMTSAWPPTSGASATRWTCQGAGTRGYPAAAAAPGSAVPGQAPPPAPARSGRRPSTSGRDPPPRHHMLRYYAVVENPRFQDPMYDRRDARPRGSDEAAAADGGRAQRLHACRPAAACGRSRQQRPAVQQQRRRASAAGVVRLRARGAGALPRRAPTPAD